MFLYSAYTSTAVIAHIIAGSQTAGTFNTLAGLQQERFRVQLSKPVDDSTDLNATSKAATYYQSCVDTTDDMDSQALESLSRLLSDLGIIMQYTGDEAMYSQSKLL